METVLTEIRNYVREAYYKLTRRRIFLTCILCVGLVCSIVANYTPAMIHQITVENTPSPGYGMLGTTKTFDSYDGKLV